MLRGVSPPFFDNTVCLVLVFWNWEKWIVAGGSWLDRWMRSNCMQADWIQAMDTYRLDTGTTVERKCLQESHCSFFICTSGNLTPWQRTNRVAFVSSDDSDHIFSSPEPLGSQGELIVYPWSGVRPSSVVRRPSSSTISNIFFSKTAWPIKAKFYMEPAWVGRTKVCSRHLGHMTKMAATPI